MQRVVTVVQSRLTKPKCGGGYPCSEAFMLAMGCWLYTG